MIIFTRYLVDLFSNIEQQKSISQKFTCKTKCFIYDNGPLNLPCNVESQEANEDKQENFDESELEWDSINWHSYKDGKYINLTTTQKHLAESLPNKEQKIAGVAGSGKTQVLAIRAANAQKHTSEYILILTFNNTLKPYLKYRLGNVRVDFDWNKIRIYNYHNFYKEKAKSYLSEQDFNEMNWDPKGTAYDKDIFANQKTPKYGAIFIDEVQDFKNEWLRIIYDNFRASNCEFVVFGDPKQNIYDYQNLDKDGNINLGIIGGKWNGQLTKGHRFQYNGQIAKLATDFQKEFFINTPIDEDLQQGSLFDDGILYEHTSYNVDNINNMIMQIIQKHNLETRDTAILSNTKESLQEINHCYQQKTNQETITTFAPKLSRKAHQKYDQPYKDNFTMAEDALKFSTIHSFKGWEAENIILILIPSDKQNKNLKDLIYVAITRAKNNLIIVDCDNSKYSTFFKSHSKPLQLN